MAQGKLKVKSKSAKLPPASARKSSRGGGGQGKAKAGQIKKGNKVIAPKKLPQQQAAAIRKAVVKGINANIEHQLGAIAKKAHEGKPFLCIEKDIGGRRQKKK